METSNVQTPTQPATGTVVATQKKNPFLWVGIGCVVLLIFVCGCSGLALLLGFKPWESSNYSGGTSGDSDSEDDEREDPWDDWDD